MAVKSCLPLPPCAFHLIFVLGRFTDLQLKAASQIKHERPFPTKMRSTHRSLILALLIAAALAGGYFASRRSKHHATTFEHPPVSKSVPTEVGENQPPDHQPLADLPDTRLDELSPAPQASKARKDANGNSIMETIMTPDGPVKIHRTFTTTGQLVRERAFLNGREVSVPLQTRR